MTKQSLHGEALSRWYQQFSEALGQQPGVERVSYESVTPLSGSGSTTVFGTPFSNGEKQIYTNDVGPNYFQTMRIPLLEGRDYRWTDTRASGLKIILNQAAAKILFPGRSAIGESIHVDKERTYEIIAVVGDVHYASIREDAQPGAYYPITQGTEDEKRSFTAVVRVNGPAAPLAAASRTLAARMSPDIPAPIMTTLSETLDDSIRSERMMAMLSVFFAACALLVTAIGLYGTLAYATARRTNEIGIRMALGARRVQVVVLVFRENSWVATGGCLAGLAAALLASRVLASFLYGTSVRDPWVLLASVAALMTIASAASLLPAIRAARIEPMQALRSE
jgi:predicted permease